MTVTHWEAYVAAKVAAKRAGWTPPHERRAGTPPHERRAGTKLLAYEPWWVLAWVYVGAAISPESLFPMWFMLIAWASVRVLKRVLR